jgi:hypothetical protein
VILEIIDTKMNKEKLKGYTSIYWSIDNIANLLGGP